MATVTKINIYLNDGRSVNIPETELSPNLKRKLRKEAEKFFKPIKERITEPLNEDM